MKKRQLLISLVLGLFLVALIPGVALGAKPVAFGATGDISYLEPPLDLIQSGKMFTAGESGRWVVASRYLKGNFYGDTIPGEFIMTYKANVTSVEVGNLHGTLKVGVYTLKVNGKVDLLEADPKTIWISGHWTFIEGAKGHGEFTAVLVLKPDEQPIRTKSQITLTGKWQQPQG
jgi:hypothetical protein